MRGDLGEVVFFLLQLHTGPFQLLAHAGTVVSSESLYD